MKTSVQFRLVLMFSALLFILQCTENKESKVYENGALATAAPIATDIGLQVFKQGGNAFDVAIAVGFALAVVHPEAGNLGGGGFAVIREAKSGDIKALDFREKAPMSASEKMYLDSNGHVIDGLSTLGALSAGVPGTVAGLYELWQKHGSMKWSDLVIISAALADSGFVLDEYQSNSFKENQEDLSKYEVTADLFFPNGRVPNAGERLELPELSRTLAQIAENGPKAFYSGGIADSIIATMQINRGIITREDLENYIPVWREPIHFTFDSLDVYSMPPPSSGGIVLGEILKTLERYDFSKYSPMTTEYIHLFCESARLAYADRSLHLGDPDFYDIPEYLLHYDYISERADLIDLNHANKSSEIQPGNWDNSSSKQTTHFSIADKSGNIVALTYTLNSSYGSKLAVRGCGFLLNNEMDDFAIAPGHANLYGLVGGEANKIEPGKKMLSSMSPTIVLKNNRPLLAIGSPGGSEIITVVAQSIINFSRFDLSLDQTLKQPRMHHQWLPDMIELESNSFNIDIKQGLIRMGHNIAEFNPSTDVHAVSFNESGLMTAASDPRRRGTSGGF